MKQYDTQDNNVGTKFINGCVSNSLHNRTEILFGCPFLDSPMSPCWKDVRWRYLGIFDTLAGDRF